VTTGGAGIRALDKAFSSLYNLPNVMDDIQPAGKTDPLIIQEIFIDKMGREASPSDIEKVCNAYIRFLKPEVEKSSDYRVLPGVKEFLTKISGNSHFLIGLGTGNLEKGARIKLEPSGLNPYFSFGGYGSDSGDRSEVLQTAVKRARNLTKDELSPKRIYVIGDTVLDVSAARKAGYVSVAVASGHASMKELESSSPDFLMESLVQPDGFMKQIWEG